MFLDSLSFLAKVALANLVLAVFCGIVALAIAAYWSVGE
jgi:hypothetical protein